MKDYVALVVMESDTLFRRAQAAAAKLGERLRYKREVLMAAKKFSERVAKHPSWLRVDALDVVGFWSPANDRPHELQPVVFHEGQFKLAAHSFVGIAGDYCLLPREHLPSRRAEFVESCGRKLGYALFVEEAITAVIHGLDVEDTLQGLSCNPNTCEVTLDGDDGGRIAARLPRWIRIEKPRAQRQAHAQATPSSSAVKASATARTYNSSS